MITSRRRSTQTPPELREPIEMRLEQRQGRSLPRLFLLKWNNSHMRTIDPAKYNWHEAWGTLYPTGKVTLDYGALYSSLTDLKEQASQAGIYIIQWVETEEAEKDK